ncbi:hypothetical protein P5663_19245 [Priestia flexa]|uniref:hypothetical protein n=1 Tax=Priestia flexa TaxID=86664 RepID=UPI00240CEDEA|nr:hypothetical protein [Priestia flexa]WEZ08132.1 hypothetical protein P5663_19245 [Priestia flexa]
MKTKKEKPALNYLNAKNKAPKGNFTQVPNEILFGLGKYEILKSNDVRVYAAILKEVTFRNNTKQFDKDGDAFCYMNQEQLMVKTNIGSRKTIQKCVEKLESLGLVYACSQGIKKSYKYFIAFPDVVENDEKAITDEREIGKKLSDEQKAKNKAAREKARETKEQKRAIKEFVSGIDEDEMPDFDEPEEPDFQSKQIKLEGLKLGGM